MEPRPFYLSPMTRNQKLQFAALLLLAACLRLPGAFSEAFWSDEYFSWVTATQPSFLQFFLRCAGVDVYPPLSYVPAWLLAKASDAHWLLRLPAALSGVGCVAVVVLMMRRYASFGGALALGLLAAFNPLSVYLGWEAKAYNFFALMNLLMLDEGLRILETPDRGWKRLALWVAGSMYSFFLSPYFLAALIAGAWWREEKRTLGFRLLCKGVGVGLLWSLPLLPFFLKTVLVYSGSSAFNVAMERVWLFSFENFSAGFWLPAGLQALAVIAFALGVSVALRRATVEDGPARWPSPTQVLGWMAFLPPLLFWGVSLLTGKPNYNDRAMLVCSFAWTLLAGMGALALPEPRKRILFSALLVTQAYALWHYHTNPAVRRTDYAPAFSEISAQWKEGDVIFHGYFESGLPFKYFAAREVTMGLRDQPKPNHVLQKMEPFTSNQAAQGIRAAWRQLNAWLKQRGLGVEAGTDPVFIAGPQIEEALKGKRRIWFVLASDEAPRKQLMQVPNAWRSGMPVERGFKLEEQSYLKTWKLLSQSGGPEARVRLYARP